jgi:YD repeat-containing protein
LRKLLVAIIIILALSMAAAFAGPVTSGALFRLLLNLRPASALNSLAMNYKPLHKGHIDLATGLYIRENEDIVVFGSPALILRRTYLSGYRVSRHFGIGTTHNGEEYLIGDPEGFQWVAVILATGARLNFKRISPGTSFVNAMFVHDETRTEWRGARLGWTGTNWGLQKSDGSTAVYRGCGGADSNCSILQSRDPAGRTTYYRRNDVGTLLKIDDGGNRWIGFEYDDKARVIRAHASTKKEVRYEYDSRGRLTKVTGSDGIVHRYTHTEMDELATIEEPGTSIENEYKGGRCVRQVNRYPDREPYIFDFTYEVMNGHTTRTTSKRSDGSWIDYTWGDGRYSTSETWGQEGYEPAVFAYERDPATNEITALTVTCPDRTGRPLRHSSNVRPGHEQRIKQNLLQTHCHWKTR